MVLPFDGDGEVAGFGTSGGERVDAVCIVPASQLARESCRFHGSAGVVESRLFGGRNGPGEPLMPQGGVGVSLDERLVFPDHLGGCSLSLPNSGSIVVWLAISGVDLSRSIEISESLFGVFHHAFVECLIPLESAMNKDLRVVWFEPRSLVVVGNRPRMLSLKSPGGGAKPVIKCAIRVELD